MPRFDPSTIGEPKKPDVNDTTPYLKDTDQRWFHEVEELYPSDESEVWDGTGYAPRQVIRKLTGRYLADQVLTRLASRYLGD